MEDIKNDEKSSKMLHLLDWAYEKSLNGIPGMGSATDLAHEFDKGEGTLEEKAHKLIHWQMAKTATTGFVTGLGGLITLPVSIPADISSAIYVQLRMIAAIAHLGGFDVKDDKVKTLVYICLVGESAKDIIKDVGIEIGIKVGQNLLEKLPSKLITKINQRVGFRLATKFGTKGAINLVKIVPIFGGVVGGSINAIATNTIGQIACKTFIHTNEGMPIAMHFTDNITIATTVNSNLELLKFYSYINIIKVDGVKKQEEYVLFDNMINNSLLEDQIKMDLIQKLNSNEVDKIDYSIFKNNPNQALNLLSNLIHIAKCDNEFHITEKMYIKNIAKQLDYSENDIVSLMNELV